MSTTIERYATPEEIKQLEDAPKIAAQLNACADKKPFAFFAAFDGTDADKNNIALSGRPYQTNIANLYDMAKGKETQNFRAGYYPGVGTGGASGNLWNAGPAPTQTLQAIAEKAYFDFAEAAYDYLNTQGARVEDLSAVTVGFSRGNAAGVMFAKMLDQNGLQRSDHTVIAPPHSVLMTGIVMIDPVYTAVEGNLSLPGNVHGDVLLWGALDETRYDFKRADYGLDPRVKLMELPGNHSGLGGGYDQHGSAASVLEGCVAYLRTSGVNLGPVPPQLQFNPSQPVPIYSEVYRTARNGDRLPDGAWPQAGSPGHRATLAVPAPSGVDPRYAQGCGPQPQNPPASPRPTTTQTKCSR
ncbi:MAG: DUF2235 domain-containing protein [Burkholderiaceae bacterium]|jgi:hypothetical protein|nr:DUF2235 domain-containing protein [Burkholderiaceae bacterium]